MPRGGAGGQRSSIRSAVAAGDGGRPKRAAAQNHMNYGLIEKHGRIEEPEYVVAKPSRKGRKKGRPIREKPTYAKEYGRVMSQLARIRKEEAFLMAYAADGWRGASREKLRPEQELRRAKKQIFDCKIHIREAIKICDEAQGDKHLPPELFDENGEIVGDDIFCAKCGGYDPEGEDNDIIMCDGMCCRAYHQKCVDPILATEDIPEDPEGWLCPSCDAKVDIMWNINEEFGTSYKFSDPWSHIFAEEVAIMESREEAALLSPTGRGVLGTDWPSDDEDDEDFDPAARELPDPTAGGGGGGSDSGGDADTDGEGSSDEGGSGSGEDSCGEEGWSDEEVEEGPLSPAAIEESDSDGGGGGRGRRRRRAPAGGGAGASGEGGGGGRNRGGEMGLEEAVERRMLQEDADRDPAGLICQGKRRRTKVDYCRLNDEMFGNTEAFPGEGVASEDEEYKPGVKSPAGTPHVEKKGKGSPFDFETALKQELD